MIENCDMQTQRPVRPHEPVSAEVMPFEASGEQGDQVIGFQEAEDDEPTEECQEPQGLPDPGKPTAQEIATHNLTHLPHRSWCPVCIKARARDRPHRPRRGPEEKEVPEVVFDYGFMGARGDDDTQAILVIKDRRTRMHFSHVVPRKGLASEHGAKVLLEDLKKLGYGTILLKCDGEPALKAVQEEVARQRSGQTLLENSPVGDSQANGAAERAVQSVSEQIRVIRLGLERRLGVRVPGAHPVTTWIVEHASDLLNKFLKGDDGKTPYQRLRGKTFNGTTVEFGERVHYLENTKGSARMNKLEGKWSEGFYLGTGWRTGAAVIGTKTGVIRSSAVRRVGEHRRWDAEGIMEVRGVPWKLTPDLEEESAAPKIMWLPPDMRSSAEEQRPEEPKPRRVYLKREDFFRHGFTEDCPGCRTMIGLGKDRKPHSDRCRERMEKALGETEDGSQRIKRSNERVNEYIAGEIKRQVDEDERKRKHLRAEGGPVQNQQHNQPTSDGPSASSDTPMMSSGEKRIAEHVAAEETGVPKKAKGDDDAMEDADYMEAMREDFYWELGFVSDMCEPDPLEQRSLEADYAYFDEGTGERLDPKLVALGEKAEMDRFKKMGVYDYVDREVAENDLEGKFVKVKWVRTNKGTTQKPEVRCRLVGQELAYGQRMDEMFTATPSLSSVRLALHHAGQRGKGRKLMCLDVRCAFLYADAQRKIYIELPYQDDLYGTSKVGILRKAMYGTRDAPLLWGKTVKRTMESIGLKSSALDPCVYHHAEKELFVVVHVDDFLISGNPEAMTWLTTELEKQYDLKKKTIGPNQNEEHELKYLNRVISWDTDNFIRYRGDDKHSRRLIEEWGLDHAKGASVPMSKEQMEGLDQGELLGSTDARRVRGSIARLIFMSMDRPDLAAAARALSQRMQSPREGTQKAVFNVVKYIRKYPVCHFEFFAEITPEQNRIRAWSDSDWATDIKGRRSVSGGVVLLGPVPIAHWSKTQGSIALSSGEAELNAAVKTVSEMVGVANLYQEVYGENVQMDLSVDASACKGMIMRAGRGRVKHLSTKQLWIQGAVEAWGMKVHKIPRNDNCADILTHSSSHAEVKQHLQQMSYYR